MLCPVFLGARIEGLVRKEAYELPVEAIREMIVNAHCHRNLADASCVQVAVYDDRLEVTSPGGLYNGLTYEEIMSGHSKLRNKGIANIFNQMGFIEAWGTGIRRIKQAAKQYELPNPEIQVFDDMFRVNLYRRPFSEIADDSGIGEASEKHRRNIGEASEKISMRHKGRFWSFCLWMQNFPPQSWHSRLACRAEMWK